MDLYFELLWIKILAWKFSQRNVPIKPVIVSEKLTKDPSRRHKALNSTVAVHWNIGCGFAFPEARIIPYAIS